MLPIRYEKLKKMNFVTFKTQKKKTNLPIGSRSRRVVVVSVQVWVFWVRVLCRVRISGRFGRVGLTRQSPMLLSLIITRDCGGVSTFLSSDSESTHNLESIGYLSDLSDFRVPSYGSISDFRGESPFKTGQIQRTLLRFKPKLRNRTITRHTKVRKVRQIPYRPKTLRIFKI